MLHPLATPAQRGQRQHGCTAAPGKARASWVRRCGRSGLTREKAHLPCERRHNTAHSTPRGFALGTAAGHSSTDLSKRSFTLAYKTPCDFEVTTVIMEQEQKSSNFPWPQELLPASCLQAFPAPHWSLHLKHRFCHHIHSSYRGNYSTATIPLESHLALTQKLKHRPHPQAPHLAGTVSTQWLPRSIWPQQTDGETAVPPAARAPAGFSPTTSGSGQLSLIQKQSLETTAEANSRLKLTKPQV